MLLKLIQNKTFYEFVWIIVLLYIITINLLKIIYQIGLLAIDFFLSNLILYRHSFYKRTLPTFLGSNNEYVQANLVLLLRAWLLARCLWPINGFYYAIFNWLFLCNLIPIFWNFFLNLIDWEFFGSLYKLVNHFII